MHPIRDLAIIDAGYRLVCEINDSLKRYSLFHQSFKLQLFREFCADQEILDDMLCGMGSPFVGLFCLVILCDLVFQLL